MLQKEETLEALGDSSFHLGKIQIITTRMLIKQLWMIKGVHQLLTTFPLKNSDREVDPIIVSFLLL